MNRAELIAAIREERLDDTVEPYLYSDERITRAFNEAIRQATARRRMIVDSQTAACCTYAVAADESLVTLHARVFAVRTARWDTESDPLVLTTLRRLEKIDPDWINAEAGTPTHLVLDETIGQVRLWPTPSAAGTLNLAVWRAPIAEANEILEGDEDEPVIPEPFHYDLLHWAEHLLFLNKDGEEGDPARSAAAARRFEAAFGAMPSAYSMRLWGLPRAGQTAHFD